jgi:NAD(P)H-nitrite reductase large subunit
VKNEEALNDDLICYCIGINKKIIINSIKKGNITLKSIKDDTKACTGDQCKIKNPSGKCCAKDIQELIKLYSNTEDKSSCKCCVK